MSQLDHDLPLEARRRRRFPHKYQRPLSERERGIVDECRRRGVPDGRGGVDLPVFKVLPVTVGY